MSPKQVSPCRRVVKVNKFSLKIMRKLVNAIAVPQDLDLHSLVLLKGSVHSTGYRRYDVTKD